MGGLARPLNEPRLSAKGGDGPCALFSFCPVKRARGNTAEAAHAGADVIQVVCYAGT